MDSIKITDNVKVKQATTISLPSFTGLAILFAIISYFTYGQSIDMMLAFVLLTILLSICLIAALVPFIGPIVFILLGMRVQDWVFNFTGLYSTTLVTVLFIMCIIFSAIITAIPSLILGMYIADEI